MDSGSPLHPSHKALTPQHAGRARATRAERATAALELDREEPGTHSVRRVLRQQIKSALDQLERTPLTDGAVHAARKDLRRARATLRLLREALGDSAYARENAVLRDVARPLSAARDARVLLDQLEALVAHAGGDGPALPVSELKRDLRRESRAARRVLLQQRSLLELQRETLRRQHERSARWSIGQEGWPVLGAGLKRVYARGRRGLAEATAKRSPENLHEWRKQAKYLWHELHLLKPLWPGVIGELADQAHKLADYLGNDHDLALLRERVVHRPELVAAPGLRGALLALIDRARIELEDKAFVLGERIYEQKPQAFSAQLGRYWGEWHRGGR